MIRHESAPQPVRHTVTLTGGEIIKLAQGGRVAQGVFESKDRKWRDSLGGPGARDVQIDFLPSEACVVITWQDDK